MKNLFPLLLGPLLTVSCSLHDTGYLQSGDLASDQGGGSGMDSGASGGAGAGVGGGATGGDQAMACGIKCASSDTIADFESNDGRLCLQGGGSVVAYGDGTGTQSPAMGDVKSFDASNDCDRGSAYALHALGGGAKDYGTGIELGFPQNVNAVKAGYKGIRFKAKTAITKKISIKVAIPTSLDASFGGSCEPTQSPMKLCNDHPASVVVIAAGGWLDYEVEFSSLKQEGWGVPAELSFEAIEQVHVVFPGPVSGGYADYDVWLDDFAFYK